MDITHENLHIFTIPKEMTIHHSFKEYLCIPVKIEQHPQTLLMSLVVTDKDLKYEYECPEDFIGHVTNQYDKYVEDNEQAEVKRQARCKIIIEKYQNEGIPHQDLFERLEDIDEYPEPKEESLIDLLNFAKSFIDDLSDFEDDDYGSRVGGYKDCEDVLKMAHHLDKGERFLAYEKAYSLDTFVREGIPESVWDYFEEMGVPHVRDK